MARVVWLRWSFVLIALSGNFKIYGALPLQEDKPAEPKDFATKNPKLLDQSPTRPVALMNPEYVCSFNALMQVLWILEPLNTALKMQNDIISHTYLASINAKNKFSGPLSLQPFIERMNFVAKETLVNPADILDKFFETIAEKAYGLFLVNYSQRTYCENKEKIIHTTEDLYVPAEPKYLTVNVTKKSTNLQEALTSAQELDTECICGKKLKRSLTFLSQIPPMILAINTDRQGEGLNKVLYPYTFPIFNLKFGNKLYDLVGVIFHTGETIGAGHYYAWVEQNGTWYKCNDEEIKSFAEIQKESEEKKLENADYFNFTVPLKQTSLFFYLEKSIHLGQLMQSSFAQATLQKKQLAVARDVWQQKEAFIDQRIKNFGATIEENLKKQWEPVFQGMLDA